MDETMKQVKCHFLYDISNARNDELFELGRELSALRFAIKQNPKAVCDLLIEFENTVDEKLLSKNLCPVCGGKIRAVRYQYGRETYMCCEDCGYKTGD